MATRKYGSTSTNEVNTDEAIDIFDEFSAQIKQEEFNATLEQVKDLPTQEKHFANVLISRIRRSY